MVIIKCNAALSDEDRRRLEINIHDQAADGVIVLPWYCDILGMDENGPGIKIIQETKSKREAELEQELARAMYYISAQKDCDTCRYEGKSPHCCCDCMECNVDGCRCRHCHEGSLWEWRGHHG